MLPEPVIQLLRVQRGVVATRQLHPLSTTERRRVLEREPELERLTPRVLRHRVADRSRDQHLVAAVLDAGDEAGLWGKSAAALWGSGASARPHPTSAPDGPSSVDRGWVRCTCCGTWGRMR